MKSLPRATRSGSARTARVARRRAPDALAEFGVRQIDMPLTSVRVWQAIVAAKLGA